ncbi:MAG: hypothetical protein HYW78_03700 [Parcubacteria group bacterium]|nr:hypothetical protein [Parcubacteria group bacterium]
MRCRQRKIKMLVVDLVLLKFYLEEDAPHTQGAPRMRGETVLRDNDIQFEILKRWLRPVTKNEWAYFCSSGLMPEVPIVAFGISARGPEDSGGFAGVPYLDTDGNVKVIENWTRGSTGDQWNTEWEFVFLPAKPLDLKSTMTSNKSQENSNNGDDNENIIDLNKHGVDEDEDGDENEERYATENDDPMSWENFMFLENVFAHYSNKKERAR